jgi:hypothetical protein
MNFRHRSRLWRLFRGDDIAQELDYHPTTNLPSDHFAQEFSNTANITVSRGGEDSPGRAKSQRL